MKWNVCCYCSVIQVFTFLWKDRSLCSSWYIIKVISNHLSADKLDPPSLCSWLAKASFTRALESFISFAGPPRGFPRQWIDLGAGWGRLIGKRSPLVAAHHHCRRILEKSTKEGYSPINKCPEKKLLILNSRTTGSC